MKKLAKIESPSPDEKKHISEEEMYIDQPVVDNAKNNKILYKRSMKKMSNYNNIYDEMVKEAYENIVDGFDKEAYHEYSNIPEGQMHRSQKAWKAAEKGKLSAERIHEIATNPGAMAAIKEHVMKHKGLYGAGAGTLAAAGIATGAYKALKNKKKSQEEETAEKAAAYYEAAVMAKEAAEADYANACAYEDAALEILADLGYID